MCIYSLYEIHIVNGKFISIGTIHKLTSIAWICYGSKSVRAIFSLHLFIDMIYSRPIKRDSMKIFILEMGSEMQNIPYQLGAQDLGARN